MTTFSGNRMDGKVCVVTGATQGLGAAIARRLAAAGAKGIVITGRNSERGTHVVREIAEHTVSGHISCRQTSPASRTAAWSLRKRTGCLAVSTFS
jgi:NAD(P)-dependent dehydrogenase (short-subunit alcohol dehydrogenase family)